MSQQTDDIVRAAGDWNDARAALRRAEQSLVALLNHAIRARLKPGMVIDTNQRKGLPGHLWGIRVLSGSDRGSRIYQVVSEPHVEIGPHLELAHWHCKALPVSEKTGKVMSASVHGAESKISGGALSLRGELFGKFLAHSSYDGKTPDELDKCFKDELQAFVEAPDAVERAVSSRKPKP